MNHDFYSPMWTEYRGAFAENVAAIAKAAVRVVDQVFGALHAHQFDAPWRRQAGDTRYSTFR
jgi:hypothetical protein